MIFLVDQDGVLADFERAVRDAARGIPELRDHVVEYEDRKNFYVADDYPRHLRGLVKSIFLKPGFFRSLKPVEGALQAMSDMIREGHDVRICTAPLSAYRNCVLEKFEWVENHLGFDFTKRIIIAKDKTFIGGDYLIDDRPVVQGVLRQSWARVVFDCPYNQGAEGLRLVSWSNWRDLLRRCR